MLRTFINNKTLTTKTGLTTWWRMISEGESIFYYLNQIYMLLPPILWICITFSVGLVIVQIVEKILVFFHFVVIETHRKLEYPPPSSLDGSTMVQQSEDISDSLRAIFGGIWKCRLFQGFKYEKYRSSENRRSMEILWFLWVISFTKVKKY